MKSTTERRNEILVYLCERRHSNLIELIREFKVSRRTIIRDLEVLSCSYPVFSTKGNGGGVHIADWFRLNKKYLTTQQTALLQCSFGIHSHDEGCRNETGDLTCGMADFVLHRHNEYCLDQCTLPEYPAHQHEESCFQDGIPVCGLEECIPHVHSEAEGCYTT